MLVYKLVAMDMDGTLLNSDKYISEENQRLLDYIKKLNINISLSTGRLFTSAKGYANYLGGGIYIISCNGAYVTDTEYNDIAFHPMGKNEAEAVIDICHKYNIYFHFFDRAKMYLETDLGGQFVYLKGNDLFLDEDKLEFVVDKDLKKLVHSHDMEILKYVIVDRDKDKLKKVRNELEELNVEISSSTPTNIEVTTLGVNKGLALTELMNYLGISKDEVLAMGDSENDISMLKMAGISVAMGNGRKDVKNMSDYVTATENNNGVAQALRHFIVGDDSGI